MEAAFTDTGAPVRFTAIDVETANPNMASICSVGAARFENGQLVGEWYTLTDPQDYFDAMNVSIHGIEERDVIGAPRFADVIARLNDLVGESVAVSHMSFDRTAIRRASQRCSVVPPEWRWLDSSMVARRTWADCARSGYGLADLCDRIGYDLADHHNALADAKAAGHVLLAAMTEGGRSLSELLERVQKPINPSSHYSSRVVRDGNPDGTLNGEVVVFTGALEIPRREAADLAAAVGCEVASSVTKKTTLLVVGDTDVAQLAGHAKSSKHRKAEVLMAQGVPIRIIGESDFRELVSVD